jgi:flagellar hook-associated protein 3 FlgL
MYASFTTNIALQESQINTLEQQIASGVSVSTPNQGPAAYETATLGNDQISAITNQSNTQSSIQSQLGSANTAYQSVSSVLNNVQAIIEQALNGTESSQNLQSLANQVTSASQQVVALGNTRGANGTYVFGGSRGTIAPFQPGPAGSIVYMGDGAQSQANVTPDTTASTIANGTVFMSGLNGNGFASVTAAAANTGGAVLISNGVASPAAAAAFQSGSAPVTLNFVTDPVTGNLTYTTTQNSVTSAASPVTAGMSLQLGGIGYQLTGAPAAGDSFTVSPSRPQSAFTLMQSLAATLAATGGSVAQQAQTRQQLNEGLSSLVQYQQSVITAQAQNGVTLQAVTHAGASNSSESTALQAAVQSAVGVNMPAALTTLNETVTAVQAAMKAFGSVQSLSLFNYL